MRGRKLLDQTLPLKAAGTLVSLLERIFLTVLLCQTKVKVSRSTLQYRTILCLVPPKQLC